MGEIDTRLTTIPGLKLMFNNEDSDLRRQAYYETICPATRKLAERGVHFYQITASDFFNPIKDKIKKGELAKAVEIFDGAAIVCQLGDDRSKKVKSLAKELGGNPALTTRDARLLAQGGQNSRIGMSWGNLGTHIDEGEVNASGELIPDGYNQPIKRVIGFVDAGGATRWQDIDLVDVELFSRLTEHFCINAGLERLDLEVIVVEGKSAEVDREIAEIRTSLQG